MAYTFPDTFPNALSLSTKIVNDLCILHAKIAEAKAIFNKDLIDEVMDEPDDKQREKELAAIYFVSYYTGTYDEYLYRLVFEKNTKIKPCNYTYNIGKQIKCYYNIYEGEERISKIAELFIDEFFN